MPASKDRPTSDLRRDLEARLRSAAEGILSSIRHTPAAATDRRDLTLPAAHTSLLAHDCPCPRRPATFGCTRSSWTASASSPAMMEPG